MIRLFVPPRRRLFLLLAAVALGELGAAIVIAEALHGGVAGSGLAILSAATLAAFALQILQRRISEAVGLSYAGDVRGALFRHLMRADPEVVRKRKHGAMLQSFVGDLTALRQWVSEGLVRGTLAIVALTGILSWLAFSRPQLAAVLLAIAVLVSGLGAALLVPLHKAVTVVRRERGRVAAFASECLSAQRTIFTFGRGESEAGKLDRRVAKLNRASLKRAWLTGALRALPHLGATAMLATVVLADPRQSMAGVAASLVVVGIMGIALRDLARAGELMIPGRVSMTRIAGLLNVAGRRRPSTKPADRPDEAGLVIEGLELGHGRLVVAAAAAGGDVVLLSGEPDLAPSFFAALSGRSAAPGCSVRWNGEDLVGMRPARSRELVGVASPQLPLISGSAARNIRYRAPQIGTGEIERLAALWGIDPSARDFDPSAVMLLRAIAGSPPVLLLDLAAVPLPDRLLLRLGQTISSWPGVVIMSSEQEALRRLATSCWTLSDRGMELSRVNAIEPVRLVEAAEKGSSR